VIEERDIVCGQCKASLKGHAYRKYKLPIKPTIQAFFLGSVVTIGTAITLSTEQNAIHHARYPVAIEYALINSCATADHSSIPHDFLKRKLQACTCALEKTMGEIPYDQYHKDKSFTALFRSNIDHCW
jgi:hypothetical protein